ncbi:MAG TPA: CU044_5270 family protein [Gaiellaceae bacterium]|nr:CU044_5270 family protein [Gaiellaceae bacterium]
MKSNAHVECLAELAPVQDEDLAAETWTPDARALLDQILANPVEASPQARRIRVRTHRRRWLAMPALAAAAGAFAVAILVTSGGRGTASAAAASLEKAATVARVQPSLVPNHHQYVYTKSINAYTDTVVPVAGVATSFTALVPHVRELWLGPAGGRLYETAGTPEFLTAQDRERWVAAGRPELGSGPSEDNLPPARPLDLPSDPDVLYARLKRDAAGHGSGLYREMFTLVGDSLRETAATPAQRAALYQVAARLPGVELVGSVTDSIGRAGVAVAMSDQGIRFSLIFDPDTSALLGEEQVALADNPFGVRTGTRVGYATYVVQKIVSSDTARS